MPARHAAIARLGALAIGLLALGAVFTLGGVVGTETVRDAIDPLGPLAPVGFVLLSGLLGAALVPGAALAAAAGLLFGPVPGALLVVPAAVLSAVLAQRFSARTGGGALDTAAGPRLAALTSFARRHGFSAVAIQRLLPAVPDGPLSHAFGLAGVRTRDIALGTLVASGPRGFSYALLGASASNLTGPNAIAGVALNIATGLLGLTLAAFVIARERAAAQVPLPQP